MDIVAYILNIHVPSNCQWIHCMDKFQIVLYMLYDRIPHHAQIPEQNVNEEAHDLQSLENTNMSYNALVNFT